MNDDDKAIYLANVYHLLVANGELDRLEERVFEEIRRNLRAGYFETKKAKELALKQGFQVALVGRWSNRIANLEDMLFAAFSDGVFDKEEKKAVQDYAKKLGISQAEFDIVKTETKQRYKDFKATTI